MDTAVPSPGRVAAGRDPHLVALVGLAVAGLAATVGAAVLAYAGAESHADLSAFARAAMVAVPVAVGAYAWHRGPDRVFGLVLIAAGAGWAVTTLAETDDASLYTVGRIAGWLVEVLVVYLVLSFPSGRLADRVDRLLAGAMAVVVALFYAPQLVVAEDFSVPSPYTSCVRDCPGNALFALEREPAFVDAIMRPLGAVLVLLVMTGVLLRLYGRMRGSTPLTRRMLAPVVAIAMLRAAALGVAIVGRELEPTSWPIELAAWLLAIAVPAIALAFLVGLLRWRLFAGAALQHVAECLRSLPDALTLRRAFADAFDDPTVEIVFPAGGTGDGWMDCWGEPVPVPRPGSGRAVSEVCERGTVVAAIVHDAGLNARPALIEAGVSMAAVVLENQRLAAEAEVSLRELRRSRARLATGAERERRRIERDLHDGAQQRLVALRIELELAESLVRTDAALGAERLRELGRDVDEALEELRALAHGVYPPLLADRGLEEALRSVAARSSIRVDLVTHGVGRFSTEIEGAVYFCILEGLQNVLKHAREAGRVLVTLDGAAGELRFAVRDDGPGTAGLVAGTGITNMRDRVAALGGHLEVASTPGAGTAVQGGVPTR
ncbi:MAG TPA: histidine kinase [Solirubrobacteraceae bacterium]|nr:histidine kinase [Solirubrobacteraceae bacterium]